MAIGKHIAVILLVAALPYQRCVAGGFHIPELTAVGVALSDAMVANNELIGAFPYNYASMAFHGAPTLSIDSIGVLGKAVVSPRSPNSEVGTIENESSDEVLPSLYFNQPLYAALYWGIHIGVPFGLESVWPSDTFSQFATVDASTGASGTIASLHPTKSSIELYNITPSIAYKLDQSLSISIAFDYYHAEEVELNSVGSQMSGQGDGKGWAVGILYKAQSWSFGASYHSSATISIDGEVKIAGLGVSSANTEVTLPSRSQLGVSYRLSETVMTEFDIERIGWRTIDETTITSRGGVTPSGTELNTTTHRWRDIYNYRLGIRYQVRPTVALLFGTGYENTPQSENHFDASIADADRYMVSFGVKKIIHGNWHFTVGYQYAWSNKRNIIGRDYSNQVINSAGGQVDPNGTDAYNGEYRLSSHLLSLGISWSF